MEIVTRSCATLPRCGHASATHAAPACTVLASTESVCATQCHNRLHAEQRRLPSSSSSRRASRCDSHASQTELAPSSGAARTMVRAWRWSSRYADALLYFAHVCKAKSDEGAVVVKASREGVENKLIDAIRDGNVARLVPLDKSLLHSHVS